MRSPSPWSILVHPPGRASESPERPASATITHDGWPGGFETDRPHADRPMRADPQPADRSVRPAFVGVPKIAHIIRADRPDGSRIPFDPDLCIEHPLPGDEHRRRLLYRCPAEARPGDRDGDGDLWIYRELLWGMSVRNNRPYRPQETSGDCRFVTREEAREMFRDAGKEIPPELADDAAGLPADFRPYRPIGGETGVFDPSECPPEHRFNASRSRWDEFLLRVPRPGSRPAWIMWREGQGPVTLPGAPFPYLEYHLDRPPSGSLRAERVSRRS